MWRNERGLTLIELCLTLLVFSLIVLAATPKLAHTYRNLRLKSQAEAVARELKLLPHESLLTGRTWRFTVWENGNGYSVEEQVVPENFQQPVWKWQPRWRVKQRHVFPEGVRLHPENLRLTWAPGAETPRSVFKVLDDKGNGYEVETNGQQVALRIVDTQ